MGTREGLMEEKKTLEYLQKELEMQLAAFEKDASPEGGGNSVPTPKKRRKRVYLKPRRRPAWEDIFDVVEAHRHKYPGKFVSKKEIAKRANVSVESVRKWCHGTHAGNWVDVWASETPPRPKEVVVSTPSVIPEVDWASRVGAAVGDLLRLLVAVGLLKKGG